MGENATDARALLDRAFEEEARGERAAAIAAYERALALGLAPDGRYRALVGLGGSLSGVGRHQEAAHVFRVAIGEFPEMAAPQAHLALALYADGLGRQALVALLDLALRYAPLAEQAAVLAQERERLARDPDPADGWRALAGSLTRKEFVQTFSLPFLYEISGRMRAALVTESSDDDTKVSRRVKTVGIEHRSPSPRSEEPFVIPLRKVATAVPSAITIGRGSSNDIVLPDVFVSKVHAFLRRGERSWELADAGARNGAWIGGQRLDTRGAPSPVQSGDVLTFGRVVFFFLEAGSLWDRLHQPDAPPGA